MPLSLSAEQHLALADFGIGVTLQIVTQVYDPATQQVTETTVETALTAIVGPEDAQLSPDTGGQLQDQRRTFLLAQSAWPETDSDSLRRLVFDGVVYEVTGCSTCATAGWLAINTRRWS